MEAKRLKIGVFENQIITKKKNADFTIQEYNKLRDHYDFINVGIDLPNDFLKQIITAINKNEVVNNFVNKQFTQLEKYTAENARNLLKKELLNFPRFSTSLRFEVDFQYIDFDENGRAKLKETANQEIEEDCSDYLTTHEAIDLYERHKKITEDIKQLGKDLKLSEYTLLEDLFCWDTSTNNITMNIIEYHV